MLLKRLLYEGAGETVFPGKGLCKILDGGKGAG